MGIRNKSVLCLLAMLLPLAVVGTYASYAINEQIVDRGNANLDANKQLETIRIEQLLERYVTYARSLSADEHLRVFASDFDAIRQKSVHHIHDGFDLGLKLSHKHGSNGVNAPDATSDRPLQQLIGTLRQKADIIDSAIVELKIVDADGGSLGESAGFSWNPTDENLIEKALNQAETLFGDVYVTSHGQPRLGMVTPIVNATNTVVAALALETSFDPFIDSVSNNSSMGKSGEVHIAQRVSNGDAQFITPLRFDPGAAFVRIVPAESNAPIIQALHAHDSQVITAQDYRGVESLMAIQQIAVTGWGLVVKIDIAETLEPSNKLRQWIGWAIAVSIGFAALIYLFFLVPIVKRLNTAAVVAREITDGNLCARVRDSCNDEITGLAHTINTLARDLQIDQRIRSEIEARLRHQALHDELTGLFNRKYANEVIRQLTEDSHLEHSVIFIDLNGFKNVNDKYGHAAGDDVLKIVAKRLTALCPQGTTLARWGGDEFVFVMPQATERETKEFALLIHQRFSTPLVNSDGRHNISCSIGLGTSSRSKSLEQALLEADALMYKQKNKQKGKRKAIKSLTAQGVELAMPDEQLGERAELWLGPMAPVRRTQG